MAFFVRGPRAIASYCTQIQTISTSVLHDMTSISFRCKPACVFSLNVRSLGTARKDDLYRQLMIEVKGHDQAVLKSYQQFTAMAAKELDVNIVKIYEPPKTIERMSLMKSVFVHKRHFHQYEMRTHFRVFQIKNITGSTADTFLEYIQRNLPEGVAMKVTKHQLEKLPEHIKPPTAAKSTEAAHTIEGSESTEKTKSDQSTSDTEALADRVNTETDSRKAAEVVLSTATRQKQSTKKSRKVDSASAKASTSSSSTSSKSKAVETENSSKPSETES